MNKPIINEIETKNILTKSNLPDRDYVIKPCIDNSDAC